MILKFYMHSNVGTVEIESKAEDTCDDIWDRIKATTKYKKINEKCRIDCCECVNEQTKKHWSESSLRASKKTQNCRT